MQSLRWTPRAVRRMKYAQCTHMQKRFNEGSGNHMPWPFDKYRMPAAAKKWLTKYPVARDDGYEEEFVYLDEIEDRITDHYKKKRLSPRYREHYNEMGVMGDFDDLDKVYPPIDTHNTTFGRGNKLNPAHYMGSQFLNTERYWHKNDMRVAPRSDLRNKGTLAKFMEVPPETASLFRFWGFWHMFGAAFVITVGKEWLILSSSDFHHYMTFYLTAGWFLGMTVDLWLWWNALRGQERYDQRFFPLQENVDNLFNLLDRLEKKPNMGLILGKYHGYVEILRQRLVTKRVQENIAAKSALVNEELEAKYRKEVAEAGRIPQQWVAGAVEDTVGFFTNKAEQDKYFKNAMDALKKDGGAKFGQAANQNKIVQEKYDGFRKKRETDWYAEQRKNGTLPWAFATDAEKKKAAMSDKDKKAIYDSIIGDLSGKYHNFA